MSDDDAVLADELRALGRTIDATPRPDLADRVLAALDEPTALNGAIRPLPAASPPGPTGSRPASPGGSPRWRRPPGRRERRVRLTRRKAVATIALLVVVVAAAVAVGSPPVRAAIRHLFAGVEIRHDTPPSPAASPALPGEHPTDLAGAAREVGFGVLVPTALGPPDGVTVADGRVVSLTWHRASGDIRLDEFAGDLGVMFEKFALSAAERTTVGGAPALWFDGQVTIEYVGADGVMYPESNRRTDHTLIWTAGRITLRLDGVPAKADALAVAATVPR